MKVLLLRISIASLVVLAGSCHCQKNMDDNKTQLNSNSTDKMPSSMTITLDSASLHKTSKGTVEIIHKGPQQSKTDSIKAQKNKLKTK